MYGVQFSGHMYCIPQAKVVRTKSTESMPFAFSFMMVLVSFLWLCYGTVVKDINIQVQVLTYLSNVQCIIIILHFIIQLLYVISPNKVKRMHKIQDRNTL